MVDDSSKATFKVVGKFLETDAPLVKVTVKSGAVREGVLVQTKAMAEKVDEFTWSPAGHTGFFVRIKHVTRPQGDLALRVAGEAIPENEWMSVAALTDRIDKITQPFKTTIPVVIVDRVSDIPGHGDSTDVAGGATTLDRIYLIRSGLEAGKADVTLFHEMLHFGLRRFLSKPEYIRQMHALYTKDAWVQQNADEWVAGPEGAGLRAEGYGDDYIRARGVDEALASLAEIMETNPSGYRNNGLMAKAKRSIQEWIAKLGALVGNEAFARKWRA